MKPRGHARAHESRPHIPSNDLRSAWRHKDALEDFSGGGLGRSGGRGLLHRRGLTLRGLVRYVVFFVMKLKTRTVEITGITRQPHESWMTQIGRNLTDPHDGFLRDVHHVILDRDPLYTAAFQDLLRDSGVTPVRLPARSPNLNAFAERFFGSVKPSVWRESCRLAKDISGLPCDVYRSLS